jgi:hypothetical protein
MFTTLIDKVWPIVRPLCVGDRVTDSNRSGDIVEISDNIFVVVEWDDKTQIVHHCDELKIIRKRKKICKQ